MKLRSSKKHPLDGSSSRPSHAFRQGALSLLCAVGHPPKRPLLEDNVDRAGASASPVSTIPPRSAAASYVDSTKNHNVQVWNVERGDLYEDDDASNLSTKIEPDQLPEWVLLPKAHPQEAKQGHKCTTTTTTPPQTLLCDTTTSRVHPHVTWRRTMVSPPEPVRITQQQQQKTHTRRVVTWRLPSLEDRRHTTSGSPTTTTSTSHDNSIREDYSVSATSSSTGSSIYAVPTSRMHDDYGDEEDASQQLEQQHLLAFLNCQASFLLCD